MAAAIVSDDVIVEILAKLPVKSLLRFSCVCKTWYSVISDPQFSNNHKRHCILLCEDLRKFSTITTESLLTIKDPKPTPLPLPWETEPDGKIIFLGSCNGLICVDHKLRSRKKRSLILWNPSTRKSKKVPYPGHDSFNHDVWPYDWFWFGFDEFINDYKLIWLSCIDQKRDLQIVKFNVFTLKSNTWRRRSVENIAICELWPFFQSTMGALSNGALHWIIRYNPPSGGGSNVRIMAVDLATEEFRLLEFTRDTLRRSSWIGSLGGCLCLCTNRYRKDGRRELWVMKEYGVESSWTILLSITLPCDAMAYFPYRSRDDLLSFYPFLFSKEEGKEIVVFCNGRAEILKFRVEEGANEVRFEETLFTRNSNSVIILHDLHMEESLVSL